jgi:hypothetical protein
LAGRDHHGRKLPPVNLVERHQVPSMGHQNSRSEIINTQETATGSNLIAELRDMRHGEVS